MHKILRRFNAGGLETVTWCPTHCGPTGPRKFMTDVVEQIGEAALAPPQEPIGLAVWSLQKMRQYLHTQRIVGSISPEWLRQLLRRRRIHRRHTKTWKDSHDPQFWPKCRRIRRLYRQRPEGSRRPGLDEFALDNTDYRHHDEQQEAMENYLCWRNGERPINILDWGTYCRQTKKTG